MSDDTKNLVTQVCDLESELKSKEGKVQELEQKLRTLQGLGVGLGVIAGYAFLS